MHLGYIQYSEPPKIVKDPIDDGDVTDDRVDILITVGCATALSH